MAYEEHDDWMARALQSGTVATALWRAVRDSSGEMIDLQVVDADEGFAVWMGKSREQLTGQTYSTLIPTGVPTRLPCYLVAIRSGRVAQMQFDRLVGRDSVIQAEVRIVPCGDDLAFAQLFDVTDREARWLEAEQARRTAELALDQLRRVLDAAPEGFAVYRVERGAGASVDRIVVEYANDMATAPTGRPPEDWIGATLEEWFPEAEVTGFRRRVLDVVESQAAARFDVSTQSEHGWSGTFENIMVPLGPDVAMCTWHAIGDRGTATITLAESRTDPVTGLLNRAGFRSRVSIMREARPLESGIVVVVSIDHLRRLEGMLGSPQTNVALADLASRMESAKPEGAVLGRSGPDEFIAYLRNGSHRDVLKGFAGELDDQLDRVAQGLRLPPITTSGGWCALPPGELLDEALINAGLAAEASLAAGGHCMTPYGPEVRTTIMAGAVQATAILDGLDLGQFSLAFQPIVRLADGSAWGAEALARWQHPDLGLLGPAHFIPTAERLGVITNVGEWTLKGVADRLTSPVGPPRVSINVSGIQLSDSNVAGVIARELEGHRIEPSRLIVEVTESEFLPMRHDIERQLRDIRAMGSLVAIDDFGSGYSSIGYLDRLPVDVVKLDATFLTGDVTPRRVALLRSVASMAAELGAITLTEGIETERQRDACLQAGVTLGQGYLFGHPE